MPDASRWLLLIHQIPPKPAYFRVKIWRRLQRLGAVALKNSVYVLPQHEGTQEDFQWLSAEIRAGGGESSVCSAHFVEGVSDEQIEGLFNSARGADYAALAKEAKQLVASVSKTRRSDRRAQAEADLARLRQRMEEIVAIDFFHAGEG